MMSENVKPRAAVLLLLFLFLLTLPAVSSAAESGLSSSAVSAEDSGGDAPPDEAPPSYDFPVGTTVEALKLQLEPQGPDRILMVRKPDGSIRTGGLIETGDLIEVVDADGKVLSCVTADVEADSQSSSSAAPIPGQSEGNGYSVFSPGTTVESVQEELAGSTQGCTLKVKSHAGKIRGSGCICTGDTLSVLDAQGNTLGGTKAVVPGDLTRCGLPTAKACDLLYAYLIHRSTLSGDLLDAADLNRDGTVDPSDLLRLKKAEEEFD